MFLRMGIVLYDRNKMRRENMKESMVESSEENMREWVSMSDDEFAEQMCDMGRDIGLPSQSYVRDIELLKRFKKKAERVIEAEDGYNWHAEKAKAQIEFLQWPENDEWVISKDRIEAIEELRKP